MSDVRGLQHSRPGKGEAPGLVIGPLGGDQELWELALQQLHPVATGTTGLHFAQANACSAARGTDPSPDANGNATSNDALKCPIPGCAGRMTVLALITDTSVIARILNHIGLPSSPPPLNQPNLPLDLELFFDLTHGATVDSWDANEPERPSD